MPTGYIFRMSRLKLGTPVEIPLDAAIFAVYSHYIDAATTKGNKMNAKANDQTIIDAAIKNTPWSGAEQLVHALRRQGFHDWRKLPEIFCNYERIAAHAAAAGF